MPNTAVSIPNTFATASGTVQTVLLDQNYSALATQANSLNQFTNYFADTGSANSLSITVPSGLAYAFNAGLEFQVKVGNTNTSTSVTLQINASSPVTVLLPTLAAPAVGTIKSGMILTLVYDGTYFQIQTSLTGGSSGSFSSLSVSGTSTLSGDVTVGPPTSGVALTVTGNGSVAISAISGYAANASGGDLVATRAGSTLNAIEQGPNLVLNDSTNSTLTCLQQSGGQTELWQYNGSWNQVLKVLTSRGLVINAPASGAVLQITGAGSGQDQVILNSSNGTGAAADFKAVRTTSTANSVATGPNIELYDSGAGGTSLLQQSGGQTELWQYNSGWNQIWRVLTTRGLEIRAPASGPALEADAAGGYAGIDVNAASGPSFQTFSLSGTANGYLGIAAQANQVVTGSAAGDMGIRTLSGSILFSVNNGSSASMKLNTAGALSIAAPSSGVALTVAGAAANTAALSVSGGAYTPIDALGTYGGGTLTLDCSRSNVFTVTIGGNTTVSLSNMSSGQTINLRTTTSGAYTVGFSPTPKWPGGSAGTATSSGTDLWTITYDGTNYYATVLNALA